jgi:TATA-binding protein-associated factor
LIASYEIMRNDITILSSLNWNYCILDEGHIIRNPKSKATKAVKMIKALHRLILTGTPIQVS